MNSVPSPQTPVPRGRSPAGSATLTATVSACRTAHYEQTLPWDDQGSRLLTVANYEHYTGLMDGFRERMVLDATPAADVSARPQLPSSPPAIASASHTRSGAGGLIAAARTLLPVLEAGRPLDAGTLRDAMTRAFGASDAQGAWLWKDAYEAAEAAVVLFLQRYGRAMRNRAGAGAARGRGGERRRRLPHQREHQPEGHAHLPRAGRGVVRQDAHRHGEGRAVVLHRGEGPGGGVAAGEAVRCDLLKFKSRFWYWFR